MKGLPYFKWYPADAETDANFRAMDDADIGFYIRCLNHAWINQGIPADSKERARVLRTRLDTANKRWERVGKCFVTSTLYPERLINLRQETERGLASLKSLKATESVNRRYERTTNVLLRALTVESESESESNKPPKPPASGDTLFDDQTAPNTPSVVRPALPPEKKNGHKPSMSSEQRGWFQQFLAVHPKNTIQTASATKIWTEKVRHVRCFEFLMENLRRECVGDTTYMLGPGKWLADHLELYANGVTPTNGKPAQQPVVIPKMIPYDPFRTAREKLEREEQERQAK